MRVLYVAANSPWPLNSGGRLRIYSTIRLLAKHHSVGVACLGNEDTLAEFAGSNPLGVECFPVAASARLPLRSRLYPRLRRAVCADVVSAGPPSAWREGLDAAVRAFVPDCLWFRGVESVWQTGLPSPCPAVVDLDDLESRKRAGLRHLLSPSSHPEEWQCFARRCLEKPSLRRASIALVLVPALRLLFGPSGMARARNRARLALFTEMEHRALRRAAVVLFSNPADVESCARLGRVRLLPNGWDYSMAPSFQPRASKRLLFFGLLWYMPNADAVRWFLASVWPRVLREVPDAHLDIAGDYMPDMADIASEPNVTLHGFVPDLKDLIAEAACLVVPLRAGGGTRLKIIEAWAKGLPVVTTNIGCEGLGAVTGETALIADSAEGLAAHCVSLLRNPEIGAGLASNAFEHGRSAHDWSVLDSVISNILGLAQQAAGAPRAPAGVSSGSEPAAEAVPEEQER